MRKIDIEALCADKGLRITEQRRVIAQILSEAEDHPDDDAYHDHDECVDDRLVFRTLHEPRQAEIQKVDAVEPRENGENAEHRQEAQHAGDPHRRVGIDDDLERLERVLLSAERRRQRVDDGAKHEAHDDSDAEADHRAKERRRHRYPADERQPDDGLPDEARDGADRGERQHITRHERAGRRRLACDDGPFRIRAQADVLRAIDSTHVATSPLGDRVRPNATVDPFISDQRHTSFCADVTRPADCE